MAGERRLGAPPRHRASASCRRAPNDATTLDAVRAPSAAVFAPETAKAPTEAEKHQMMASIPRTRRTRRAARRRLHYTPRATASRRPAFSRTISIPF